MKINNHDAYCIEWYRRLIADGTAEDGQRIAVDMHDQLRELEQQIESEKHEREHPEPLTLEQFLEMKGEPVWVHYLSQDDWLWECWNSWRHNSMALDNYGKTWVAYAHKPGGEGSK